MDILTINNLYKSFGKKKVIENLNLKVPEHTVYGFIGRNGAGKTTTMKIILGLMKADAGEIFVNGERVKFGANKTNKYIGYLPDVPEFYQYMTPREYLKLCGEVTCMPKEKIKEKSEELLEIVGLADEKRRIKGFSRGMKQRLGIAQALINEPKLLICDEPTSALDPIGRKDILEVLHRVKDKTTVLFSTHILSDVERICDNVAFLDGGKIAIDGKLNEIMEKGRENTIIVECKTNEDVRKLVEIIPHGKITSQTTAEFGTTDEDSMFYLFNVMAENKIHATKIENKTSSLEDLFMEVVK